MTHARLRFKALGLCLLAILCMAAFMAASAQASWLVGAATLGASDSRTVKAKAHTEIVLSIPTKNLLLLCLQAAAGAGSAIKGTPLAFILANLNFSGCKTLVNEVESAGCKPAEPIIGRSKGQGILHNGEEYILLEGDEQFEVEPGLKHTRFARVDFPAATCALPDTNVSGSLVLECLNSSLVNSGSCLEHTVSHLVQQAPSALFLLDGVLWGTNATTFTGIINVELTSGEAWSCHV